MSLNDSQHIASMVGIDLDKCEIRFFVDGPAPVILVRAAVHVAYGSRSTSVRLVTDGWGNVAVGFRLVEDKEQLAHLASLILEAARSLHEKGVAFVTDRVERTIAVRYVGTFGDIADEELRVVSSRACRIVDGLIMARSTGQHALELVCEPDTNQNAAFAAWLKEVTGLLAQHIDPQLELLQAVAVYAQCDGDNRD